MKTLGRILIILAVFALVMGITYVAVNAVSSSMGSPAFAQRGEGAPRPEGAQAPLPNGGRPEGPRGEGREFRGRGILNLVFGFIKNTVIVGIIVAGVVWLKNFLDDKRRAAPQATE